VFLSYTRVDRPWVDRLQQMMTPLLRQGDQRLRLWDDSQIEPGAKWRAAIETALAEAKVALLLVSDAFLASEFVMNEEVPKLLAAAEAEGVRVLWVSLSPSLVEHTPIHEYQAVLPSDQYLEELSKPQQQRALKTIAESIRDALAASAPAPAPRVELGGGVSLPLIAIPAGEFVMGSPAGEPERNDDEGPQHRVRLDRFLIGQTPITQAQWRAVAQLVPPVGQRWQRELPLNPSHFSGRPDSDQRPVEQVIWHDAIEFCRRLSELTGNFYTLPSEAQWEYACRAGTSTPFSFGEAITPKLANYNGSYSYANGPKGECRAQTTPVGMFSANVWGLQDMHGNVWEWCLDHWHDSYAGAPVDGSPWWDGLGRQEEDQYTRRLLRGGSWNYGPRSCRSAFRGRFRPDYAGSYVGLRVVCLPQVPSLNP
jgi:formylglycine-generating enzyme required for sulfatase activity